METKQLIIWVIFLFIVGAIYFGLPTDIAEITLGNITLQNLVGIGFIITLIIGVVKIAK